MRKGYCIANRENDKGEPHWVSCSYEQYMDYVLKGKACMVVEYGEKGKVVKETKYNIDFLN